MSIAVGKVQQESELPQLRGAQFDSSGGLVNLFRGSVSFPINLVGLPGRNGLEFSSSLLYQSDQTLADVDHWHLNSESVLGLGWEMPYERIILDPTSNGLIETNRYFWMMSAQPMRLFQIDRRWSCGQLDATYGQYLTAGVINPSLVQGLLESQIEISDQAELVSVESQAGVWNLNDPTYERSYRLTFPAEENSVLVETGGFSYELQTYQFWRICYYSVYERWEVIKNDGSFYSFGGRGQAIDPELEANVVQYGIRWGHWVGPSTKSEDQSKYAKAWNLAKVSNRLGNYYAINYEVDTQTVGEGTLSYTKACRISKLTNDSGWRVEYEYQNKVYDNSLLKSPKEYLDPHKDPANVPGTTPDAYQSCYETHFLSEIRIYNSGNTLEKYVRLGYHNFGTKDAPVYVGNMTTVPMPGDPKAIQLAYGATYRRYLESITEYVGESYGYPEEVLDRYSSPGVVFNYNFDNNGQEPLGALRSVLSPLGGYTQFQYEELRAGNELIQNGGSRNITLDNFWGQGEKGTVRTWSGQDYVVCCWINGQGTAVRLNIYTWGGRWEPAFDEPLTFETPVDVEQLQVIPSQDTFVLVIPPVSSNSKTPIYLFNRHKLQSASWTMADKNSVTPFNSNRIEGKSGVNLFVLLGQDNRIDFYRWNILSQSWKFDFQESSSQLQTPIPQNVKCYFCVGQSYLAMLHYDEILEKAVFYYFVFNQLNDLIFSSAMDLDISIPAWNGFRYCQLAASQGFIGISFVTGYTTGSDGGFESFDYNVKIISWDDQYNITVTNREEIDNIEAGRFQNIPTSVLLGGGGIGPVMVDNAAIGTGPNFLRFNGQKWRCESVGIHYDGFQDLGHQYYWYAYDEQGILATENTDSGIRSVIGSVDPSNTAPTWYEQILVDQPGHNPDRYTQFYPTVSSSLTVGSQVYPKPLSSNWGLLQSLKDIAVLLNPGETIDTTTLMNGGSYLAFLILDGDQNPKDTGIVYLKNGCLVVDANRQVIVDRLVGQKVFQMFGADHHLKPINGKVGAALQAVMSYPTNADSLDETPSITLNRYSAERFKGLVSHYVVKTITQSDGYQSLEKCYQYDEAYAAADGINGSFLKFYQVTEYEGCASPNDQNNGYTVSHFYNGLPSDLLTGDPIKAYSLLDGQLQKKEVFDSSGVLKASSSTGWTIQENIALNREGSEVQKIFGAIPQVTQVSSMQEGIESIGTTTYSLVSGSPIETQGFYYDSRGRKVLKKDTIHYAYEYYEGIWNQNMLSLPAQQSQWISDDVLIMDVWNLVKSSAQTYRLWDLNDGSVSKWGGQSVYEANRENPEDFPWLSGGEPTAEQGWQKMSSVISRNSQGGVITSLDIENKPATILYDESQAFPLATFGNATLGDGILYTSFEPYQSSPWALTVGSGEIIETDSYLGLRCYELRSNAAVIQDEKRTRSKKMVTSSGSVISCSRTLQNPNQLYCFNLWYKTSKGAPLGTHLGISNTDSSVVLSQPLPSTDGKWQPYQWVVDLSDLQENSPVDVTLTIQIAGSPVDHGGSLRIDDITFAPVLSPFSAVAYDLTKLRQLGGIAANGNSNKMLYNMWDVQYSAIGPNNQTTVLGSNYSVRQNPNYTAEVAFDFQEPNRQISVIGRDQGFYDQFRSSETLVNYEAVNGDLSDWSVANNQLVLSTGSGSHYIKTNIDFGDSISVYAEILPKSWQPDQRNPTQKMGLGFISQDSSHRFLVQWDGSATTPQWELLRWNGTDYAIMETNAAIAWQPSWHLTLIEDRLLFTASGILVFNVQDTDFAGAPFAVQLGGQDIDPSTPMAIQNLVILNDLQLTVLYKDGLGSPLQSLAFESATQSIMTPFVQDTLGRKDAISFLPSRLVKGQQGVSDVLAYQNTFITNGGKGGSLWAGSPVEGDIINYHADAQGYPFSRTIYETSPLGRSVQSGGVGLPFALTPTDNPHTTRYAYGINTVDPGFLYPLPLNHYTMTIVTDPDGHSVIQYQTTLGQTVGTIRSAKDANGLQVKSSQVYDRRGNRIAGIPPQYYENNTKPQTSTIPVNASQFTYDFWGRMETSSYPDSGKSEVIYDIAGRPRFSCDAEMRLQGYYLYVKYDVLGRAVESGLCTQAWDRTTLQTKANTNPTWPSSNIQVRQTSTYDGDTTTPWMVGRLWKTARYNGQSNLLLGAGDLSVIEGEYTYQFTGEVITTNQRSTYGGVLGAGSTTLSTYTLNGRLLTLSDNITNLTESYTTNRLEQVIETLATTVQPETVCGAPSKTIKATYAYTQEGSLEATTLYKADGTVLTQRDFTYLPNGWSKGASDSFVSENLKYTEGRCTTTDQGYYNGALAHDTVTYPGVSLPTPPTYNYCFEVDALNRVTSAQNTDGTIHSWLFDANSNFTTVMLNGPSGGESRTYTTTSNTNQLTAITSSLPANNRRYNYNEVGNTTFVTDGAQSLLSIIYDPFNGKARSIERPLILMQSVFDYGPGETRVRKRVYDNNVLTKTISNTGLLEIEETANGQTQTKRGISTQGVSLIYRLENDTFYWVLPDHLGSTRMIVDENGAVQRLYSYDIYGIPTELKINAGDDLGFYNLFTGQYWDEELALYNYHARFYDPTLARFLQVDPMHQGFSPYVYVGGMPDLYTDPSGMWSWSAFGSAMAIVGGVLAIGGAIALTIATAGAASPLLIGVVVGALMGAGISSAMYGVTSAISGDFSAKDWAIQTGLGAAFGAIGGGAGAGIGSLGANAGWSATRIAAAQFGTDVALGAADGGVTGGIQGGSWESAGYGALGGAIGGGLFNGLGYLGGRAFHGINSSKINRYRPSGGESAEQYSVRAVQNAGHNNFSYRGQSYELMNLGMQNRGYVGRALENHKFYLTTRPRVDVARRRMALIEELVREGQSDHAVAIMLGPTRAPRAGKTYIDGSVDLAAGRSHNSIEGGISSMVDNLDLDRYGKLTNNCAMAALRPLERLGLQAPLGTRIPAFASLWVGSYGTTTGSMLGFRAPFRWINTINNFGR